MQLTSTAFQHQQEIPARFTCQGQDSNPQLAWKDAPRDTKSFALIVDDPDAPGETWIHWLVKDIPPNANEIPENSVPGIEVANSFGKPGYGGPCPPAGKHRYFFKLYALDVDALDAQDSNSFYQQVEIHKLATALLMGTYEKT